VAYALAIVRLILVPVIFLAVYYLYEMGVIVDRIVNVDAPVTTLAEQASVQMLDARRAERSYFLLRDPQYLRASQDALTQLKETLDKIRTLAPDEEPATEEASKTVTLYEQKFATGVALLGEPGSTAIERVQKVVRDYEKDLNDLLKQARLKTRAQIIENLRDQINSFDAQITSTVEAGDPALRAVAPILQSSSQQVLELASGLETRAWARVQGDHQEARHLLYRAEWVLSVVSALTLLLSIWISFVLPGQVVKPLVELKEAVDHAASGNYLVDLELRGEGEVVELAKSVRNLIAHLRQAV
jgi:CHASE3 domain sensor protein